MAVPQLSANQIILGTRVLSTQSDGLYLDGVKVSGTTGFFDNASPAKIILNPNNRSLLGIDGTTVKATWVDSPAGMGISFPLGAEFGSGAYINSTGALRVNGLLLHNISTFSTDSYTYTLPSQSGTVALTSNIPTSITSILGTSAVRGINKEIWISKRTDGKAGTGTAEDPFDGSTRTLFDSILSSFLNQDGIVIHLGVGTFTTWGEIAWYCSRRWKIIGAGRNVTILKLDPTITPPSYSFSVITNPYNFDGDGTTISDLTVDCNSQNITAPIVNTEKDVTIQGITLHGNFNSLRRVRVINSYGSWANGRECFNINFGPYHDGTNWTTPINNSAEDCLVESPQGNYHVGILMAPNGHGNRINNCTIRDFSNGEIGSQCAAASDIVENCFITNCITGLRYEPSSNIKIVNNSILDCHQYGIEFAEVTVSENILIRGNTVEMRNNNPWYSFAINVNSWGYPAPKNIIIDSNTILVKNLGGGGVATRAINVDVVSQGVSIINNRIDVAATGPNGAPTDAVLFNNRTLTGARISDLLDNTPSIADALGTTTVRGLAKEVWISSRTDGKSGSGSIEDPFDGSTQVKFDALMTGFPTYTHIHLGPGVFQTAVLKAWLLKTGWTLEGSGMYITTIRFATNVVDLGSLSFGVSVLNSLYNGHTDNVIIRNLTLDANWLNCAPLVIDGAGSNTFTAKIANGSPTLVAGRDEIYQVAANNGNGFMAGDVARTISGTGIPANTKILRVPQTEIAPTSDLVTLPQSTINVLSTADFASAGTFFIRTGRNSLQYISYTGKTSTSFTGCTGGTEIIRASNVITTLTQVVMSNNATVTNNSASITIGGEKNCKMGALFLIGSNNLIEGVRAINSYGSTYNFQENFTLLMASPSGTDLGLTNGATNNIIRNCVVELPHGTYGSPIAMFGSLNQPMSNSKVVGCTIRGINNGMNGGFTSGGVNMAGIQNLEISGNVFEDNQICYIDTDTLDGLRVLNNTVIRGLAGVGLSVNGIGTLKNNIQIEGNYLHIQNRSPGFGSYAIGLTDIPATNCIIRNNYIKLTYDGLGENFQMRFLYGAGGIINGEISNNILETDGNGNLVGPFTNVKIFGNRTLNTGNFPSNPDGAESLADNVGFELTAKKGVANGYAPLDATAKVPLINLPIFGSGTISPALNPNKQITLESNETWRVFGEITLGIGSSITFLPNSELALV